MIFSSVTFLFYFLPLFLGLYFLTPFKNTVLLIASLLFYAWGELGYTLLMLLSIVMNFGFGLAINGNQKYKKLILTVGIVSNLLLLTYFKYFNFISGLFITTMEDPVHLPLGISFFTFQAISYLIDVYRGDAKVEKNVFNLGLYISMFPQLIAGPIVRFKTVAQQIRERNTNLSQISLGWRVFIIGLAQKVLIANTVALPADQIFSLTYGELTTSLAWLGSLCYSLQIYFDFAGYSNMAIGLGLMMGFTFPENFSHPYVAQSITEFWRRWHKSLSGWFRDYLYIPLGGNRGSSVRTYLNLFTVFLLCGLWHGAAWTFILWGTYHGVFLVLERLKLSTLLNATWRPLRHIYLLLAVLFGWVIFRAESMEHLSYFLQAMFGYSQATINNPYYLDLYIKNSTITAIILGIVFSMPVFGYIKTKIKQLKTAGRNFSYALSFAFLELFYVAIFIYALMLVASGSYNPFIYFRF